MYSALSRPEDSDEGMSGSSSTDVAVTAAVAGGDHALGAFAAWALVVVKPLTRSRASSRRNRFMGPPGDGSRRRKTRQ
jgi:hypothetical protein